MEKLLNVQKKKNKISLFHLSAFNEIGKVKYKIFQIELLYKQFIFTTIKIATVKLKNTHKI